MFKCDLCDKNFNYKALLERHKNNKKPCNIKKVLTDCKICNSSFPCAAKLERHEKSAKHITNYNNIHNGDNININITNNFHIHTPINSFSETCLNIINNSDIEYLLAHDYDVLQIIKDEDLMTCGDSVYIVSIFKFFIKLFSKLNFNLAYSQNHNCAIFSFFKTHNNYIEYQLLEIDNKNKKYQAQCIKYDLFIEEFINLMKKIDYTFKVEKFKIILDYVIRYKKMVFSDNSKTIIENELLRSYNEFISTKDSKEEEDREFNMALQNSRKNVFKHVIENQY
jgi:hypothetical protein